MFTKLFILCALAVVALAKEYPPGVHPAVCPNYPICDAETLATHTLDGQPIPEWVYNPGVLPVAPFDPKHSAAPRYPAGFNPAICPNYPYCF
ncbi:cuticle protein 1-like [Amyelois transitella]|uniref:cuticle protein 1-like n=1 Tax=Amyelois transitella TaxID=680683 RepID=UPI00067A7FB0|nr:cuticle protein 1-like [Amyelois transitella]